MRDSLVKLIDEALAAMPRDLLAQVPAEQEVLHGPEARIPRKPRGDSEEKLMEWVRERLRPVGVALGQDQRAGKRFTGRLPKARVPLVHRADLSKVPELARMEFERIEKEYRHVEPAWPEEVQRAYREGLQDILRHGPLPHVRPRAEWPAEITRVWAEAQELTEKARAEWEAALLKQPMAWLGAVFYGLPEVTGQRAIQGLPEWPGLKELSARERTHFVGSLPLIMGREIGTDPGRAADHLFRALEELKRLYLKDVRAELAKQSGRGGGVGKDEGEAHSPKGEGAAGGDLPRATPQTDPSLTYQADAATFYNIPKSVLSKAAKKTPGEPGYLWSGCSGKGKKKRVWYRKEDLVKIARSRKALGRAGQCSDKPDEKHPAPVAPRVSGKKTFEEKAKALLAKFDQEDTESED
jgi:hypothetical protein